jgi:hypothetical protein
MHIEPLFRSIEDVLKIGFFFVPRFQRPYSWEDQHIEEFWQDTIVDQQDDEYFIGSLVLYKEGGKFGIVDGQQRLTTITMLLCAIRDSFSQYDHVDLAAGLNQLIVKTNIDNKLQAVLASESTIPYFQSTIQKLPGTHPEKATSVEERRLAGAFQYIVDKVRLTVEDIDESIPEKERRNLLRDKLRSIRDRILKLKAVALTLDNDIDAYMIFETLNTRGKDLELGDLVRTHLTRSLPQANSTTDQVRSRFDELRKGFDQTSRSLDDFILHFWLSKYEYTAKRKIYKRLRKTVTKDNAKQFLENFLEDGYLYLDLVAPSRRKWKKEEAALAESLQALQLFRVEQPIPFVLAVMRAYMKQNISLKTTKRAIRAVEHFHFAFTALTSSRSSGGISQMYSRHALAIAENSNSQNIALEIDELIEKLKTKRPAEGEFITEFKELRASERIPRNKRLVQYVLNRLSSHFDGKLLDPSKMTIEHLASQSGKGNNLSDDDRASIGNLTWATEQTQIELETKKIEAKVAILDAEGYWVDECLAEHLGQWNKDSISSRGELLAKLGWNEIWTL